MSAKHQNSDTDEIQVRKSKRVQEIESNSKTHNINGKNSKSFRETIKFDASLYQSADEDDSDDDNDGGNGDGDHGMNQDEAQEKDSYNDEPNSQQEGKKKNKKAKNLQNKVIAPQVKKNQALIEDIKMREMEASKSKKFLNIKVDHACELANVHVLDDYSCYMQLNDIAYNENEHTKFYKMQLLERNDQKKWFLWV